MASPDPPSANAQSQKVAVAQNKCHYFFIGSVFFLFLRGFPLLQYLVQFSAVQVGSVKSSGVQVGASGLSSRWDIV